MYSHVLFFIFWILNSFLIYFLGFFSPASVVLGNFRLTPFEASIYAGFWLGFFVWTMWEYLLVRKVDLKPLSLRVLYFIFVNSLGVWIISRYPEYTGFGIVNYWWAILSGVLSAALQNAALGIFGEKLKD